MIYNEGYIYIRLNVLRKLISIGKKEEFSYITKEVVEGIAKSFIASKLLVNRLLNSELGCENLKSKSRLIGRKFPIYIDTTNSNEMNIPLKNLFII